MMSHQGIRQLQTLRLMHSRFRSIFVLLGLLSLCLVVYLALRALTGSVTARLTTRDILVVGLLVIASLFLCAAQVRCLKSLSLEAARQIETMALYDDLTGVFNYRYIDYRLREELARADRTGRPLTIIYIDLDHFKSVNDRHGHQIGNALLRRIGRLLRAHSRTNDLVGRLGGDEFIAILPDTEIEAATLVADRFCRAIRRFKYRSREGTTVDYLRMSLGIAGYPRNAEDVDSLLNEADSAMYQAKREGGDKAVAATRRREPQLLPT